MASAITITTHSAALGRKLRAAVKHYPRGVAAGINRTAASAYTLAVREIQKDTGATSQKTIRRNLTVSKATASKVQGAVTGKSSRYERIPLYELKPRPRQVTKRRPAGGVKYGPLNKLIPGSFIARFQSGHTGVFKRIGEQVVAKGAKTPFTAVRGSGGASVLLPFSRRTTGRIAELFGPSVALVFSRRKITAVVNVLIKEKLPQEIARALKHMKAAA